MPCGLHDRPQIGFQRFPSQKKLTELRSGRSALGSPDRRQPSSTGHRACIASSYFHTAHFPGYRTIPRTCEIPPAITPTCKAPSGRPPQPRADPATLSQFLPLSSARPQAPFKVLNDLSGSDGPAMRMGDARFEVTNAIVRQLLSELPPGRLLREAGQPWPAQLG
jgi:hypothetical protein